MASTGVPVIIMCHSLMLNASQVGTTATSALTKPTAMNPPAHAGTANAISRKVTKKINSFLIRISSLEMHYVELVGPPGFPVSYDTMHRLWRSDPWLVDVYPS